MTPSAFLLLERLPERAHLDGDDVFNLPVSKSTYSGQHLACPWLRVSESDRQRSRPCSVPVGGLPV